MRIRFKQWSMMTLLVLFFTQTLAQSDSTPIEQKLGPYDLMSNYYNESFQPFKKGNFFAGLAFSVTDKKMTNTNYLVQQVLDGERLNYDVLLKGGYYTGDYGMVILSVNYFQDKFVGDVYRNPDTLQSNSITRGFAFTPGFRSSVPLTKNERLSFFTELGLTFGYNSSLTRNIKYSDEIEKVNGNEFNFRVGLSPGLTFFALENFALEVQLDVLGYDLKVGKKTVNEDPESRELRQNVDFNINLLSLQLGLAYYFSTGK